ncbi:retrovirus-related pol polyprotein from transposon TNT 1-94, partial [Tanacetum coccineum]
MDRKVKQLRRSRVPIVKVRWNSRRGPEFTWEREDQFRKKYPHLFTKTAPSSREQVANFDDDVDDSPENDLALNVDHIFEADQYHIDEYHESTRDEKLITTQLRLLTSNVEYTTDRIIILVLISIWIDNEGKWIVTKVMYSSVQNDAVLSIINEMHYEEGVSTGMYKKIKHSTEAKGSKPKSNTKNNRILPAKSRTGHLFGIWTGLFKIYVGESFKLKNFVESSSGTVIFGNLHSEYHGLWRLCYWCQCDLLSILRGGTWDKSILLLLKASSSLNMAVALSFRPLILLGQSMILLRKDLVRGLPDHLLLSLSTWKKKKSQSINGKKYILVIVDDYSRFTWVKFLRSKDETPEFVINFLKQIQVGLNKTVRYIRTDNGTEFVNQVMSKYYEGVGIFHQKSVPRTPQQNGVVERRNRTLVEAARTMLIFSTAPMFLWAEAVATACYTQNRSLIHTRHNKTPYELVHDKKPDLTFLRVFGAMCYPTNDSEDLGKLQAKADIGIFVGYAPSRKGYRVYNKRTRRIMETIHVTFDELHQTMAPVRISSGPEPIMMTPGQLNSGLAPTHVHATTYVPPTDKELEILFQPMFDEYFEQSRVNEQVPPVTAANAQVVPPGTSLSTTFVQDAPSTSVSPSSSDMQPLVRHQGVADGPTVEDTLITQDALHPSFNHVAVEPGSAQSSSGDVNLAESNKFIQLP